MTTITPTLAESAYHEFLRAAKLYWSRDMYASLRQSFAGQGLDDADVDTAEHKMRELAGYRFFGWFERNLQKEKYASPRGLLAIAERYRPALEADLAAAAADAAAKGLLKLNPALEFPDYYLKTFFHQHPGGVWGDELAGFVYELGRRTTMPLHVDPFAVHDLVADAVPRGDYKDILDLGCGTGRSTLPFAKRYPGARLYGVDLAAPCLKMAALNARDAGVEVRWSQQKGEALEFADGTFDLVHSTFLLHEMPVKAIELVTREVFRVLRPGGVFANLDFHSPPGGTWGQFLHYGHGRRNNEFFMRPFCEFDYLAFQRGIGFAEATMNGFDDGRGPVGAAEVPAEWRFPFQMLVARKAG